MWFLVLGFVAGTAAYDLLTAAGLHWLVWPIVGVLQGLILITLAAVRLYRRRS